MSLDRVSLFKRMIKYEEQQGRTVDISPRDLLAWIKNRNGKRGKRVQVIYHKLQGRNKAFGCCGEP